MTARSLHACRAIRSTLRRDASSNAIAVARSEDSEPSTPTSTGASGAAAVASPWMMATGQCAWRATEELTEPRTPRASTPCPAVPITIISASWDRSIRAVVGLANTNSLPTATFRSAGIDSSASFTACMTAFLPWSSRRTARDSG